jgi:hypothetical protein
MTLRPKWYDYICAFFEMLYLVCRYGLDEAGRKVEREYEEVKKAHDLLCRNRMA